MTLLPTSGIASNGKPIFDWDEAAAQLTRGGSSWSFSLGAPATISYAFRASAPPTMPSGVTGFQQFNSAQIIAAEAALQLWADVANITFVRVGAGTSGVAAYSNNATILFANYMTETDPASAFAFLPSPGATGAANVAGDIWVDMSEAQNVNPVFGDFGAHTLAHEIGHAIGINHPGPYNGGSPTYAADAVYWQDARMFTVMSYFGSMNAGGNLPSFSWGPQYHDIAAAQLLYGANMTTRTGDTIYGFNSTAGRELFDISSPSQGVVFSIWDAGGNDTLDLSGYSQNAEIDLRPGAFSSAGPTPDNGPAHLNISIVPGVVIENAVGGTGDDRLIGNHAANDLRGRTGDDWISGGAGNDTVGGGAGNDTLFGGANPDWLAGHAGADILDGGSSVDKADYTTAPTGVNVNLATGGISGDAAGDTYVSIEIVSGSNYNDTLTGSRYNDDLRGRGGSDLLDGAGADDKLYGYSGNDTLIGGAGNDTLTGGGHNDHFVFSGDFGHDVIQDMNAGALIRDVIEINGFGPAFDSFAEILAAATQVGADTVITINGNTITLIGVDKNNLDPNDFTFG